MVGVNKQRRKTHKFDFCMTQTLTHSTQSMISECENIYASKLGIQTKTKIKLTNSSYAMPPQMSFPAAVAVVVVAG